MICELLGLHRQSMHIAGLADRQAMWGSVPWVHPPVRLSVRGYALNIFRFVPDFKTGGKMCLALKLGCVDHFGVVVSLKAWRSDFLLGVALLAE
jgi:hypothetical protein